MENHNVEIQWWKIHCRIFLRRIASAQNRQSNQDFRLAFRDAHHDAPYVKTAFFFCAKCYYIELALEYERDFCSPNLTSKHLHKN
ncbi:hypothetical protein IMZ16_05400 [Cruoricaptor ignavus]|uniref:Uncharacterized protein n=1 Tax=Cruoricaptor ignavus TaxID=1118202 RepID=A0A7M1SZH3_9FLAO|nr:hypothetical protein [Cruoricaptor ignavus]QOR72986.1 hypothetical protein IMZ16_05400 [Cruoricaptor ignavus]